LITNALLINFGFHQGVILVLFRDNVKKYKNGYNQPMDTQKFLPFHAINQFMLEDFRQSIIRQVLGDFDKLPAGRKASFSQTFKRHVSIPGFRNSMAAPLTLKARYAEKAFEQKPEFVAQMVAGWSDIHSELRSHVYDLLITRKWESILTADADRSKMPGFRIDWPKEENYDTLEKSYAETYPNDHPEPNDLRLMFVWVAGSLPFDMKDGEING
jgi:hypothetical protein